MYNLKENFQNENAENLLPGNFWILSIINACNFSKKKWFFFETAFWNCAHLLTIYFWNCLFYVYFVYSEEKNQKWISLFSSFKKEVFKNANFYLKKSNELVKLRGHGQSAWKRKNMKKKSRDTREKEQKVLWALILWLVKPQSRKWPVFAKIIQKLRIFHYHMPTPLWNEILCELFRTLG